ncbi:anthranilate phosphoribosyltransferase [bacterium]|nr:anthranilate phosphoribosyltransferase [bacterium]
MTLDTSIKSIKEGKDLTESEANTILKDILSEKYNDQEILEFLKAYESKPYHYLELIGFLKAMKQFSVRFMRTSDVSIMDVCGTGGSKKDRFNISTCVVFVLASQDIHVAKHGNYGSLKPNGSFNFLEELNVAYDHSIPITNTLLEETFCCFLFARKFHPAMRKVANARRELGKLSVFNYLGPLANPIGVDYQLIGLSTMKDIDMLVNVVQHLNIKRVLFCLGGDGRDEISIEGVSHCVLVEPKNVKHFSFDFSKEIEAIDPYYECGTSAQNAMVFLQIMMEKKWQHPIIKHICINAAAGFLCRGKVNSLKEGYKLAIELFQNGSVLNTINRYKSIEADFALRKR